MIHSYTLILTLAAQTAAPSDDISKFKPYYQSVRKDGPKKFELGNNSAWTTAQLLYLHWSVMHGFAIPTAPKVYRKAVCAGPKRYRKSLDAYTPLYKDIKTSFADSLAKVLQGLRKTQRQVSLLTFERAQTVFRAELDKARDPIQRLSDRVLEARKAVNGRETAINHYIRDSMKKTPEIYRRPYMYPLKVIDPQSRKVVDASNKVLDEIEQQLAGLRAYVAQVDLAIVELVEFKRTDLSGIPPYRRGMSERELKRLGDSVVAAFKLDSNAQLDDIPPYVEWKWRKVYPFAKTLTDIVSVFLNARTTMNELQLAIKELAKTLEDKRSASRRKFPTLLHHAQHGAGRSCDRNDDRDVPLFGRPGVAAWHCRARRQIVSPSAFEREGRGSGRDEAQRYRRLCPPGALRFPAGVFCADHARRADAGSR